MFQKILAATEEPTFCDGKVQTAASLAGGKLFVLHVLESSSSMYRNFVRHFKTGEEIVTSTGYEEEVRKEIEKHCVPYLNDYEIKVTDGFPWEEIVKYERDKHVDLIVLGPHAGGQKPADVRRVVGEIGSTTDGVIHHARCPVMLINGPISEEKLAFKKILAAVDYSESCRHALKFAVKLATKPGSKLHVFCVHPLKGETQVHLEKLTTFYGEIAGDIEADCSVSVGERPHLEILKFAREKDVDLIAMGSHTRRETDGRWFPGSVVEGVGTLSNCPVVVVTDPKAAAKIQI